MWVFVLCIFSLILSAERFDSLTSALPYKRTHVHGPLWIDIRTAYDQREKAPSFNYLYLKVSEELPTRSVWVTCPLLPVTWRKWVRTFGVINWLLWPEGQHSVITIFIQEKKKVRWADTGESTQWIDICVMYYYFPPWVW